MEAHELQEAWLNRVFESAGIKRKSWRPGRGVEENRRTVEAVYGYYGRLFLEHPYLEWAGLAGMIGPAFYAGFSDLGLFPDAVRAAVIAVLGRASRRFARRAAGDLGFYETTFLTMQKKIFEDQAGMHEAYLTGGLAQIEEFYHARIIDAATLEAWRQIDSGRRDAAAATVADGNRALLFREQHDIIDRFTSACSGTGRRWARRSPICLLFRSNGSEEQPTLKPGLSRIRGDRPGWAGQMPWGGSVWTWGRTEPPYPAAR